MLSNDLIYRFKAPGQGLFVPSGGLILTSSSASLSSLGSVKRGCDLQLADLNAKLSVRWNRENEFGSAKGFYFNGQDLVAAAEVWGGASQLPN